MINLSEADINDLCTGLMLLLAPIEVEKCNQCLIGKIFWQDGIYAIHPTSKIGERLLKIKARLDAARVLDQ